MGIRFFCPNGHKLNVKSFLAGKRGYCPKCGIKLLIPETSADSLAPPGAAEKNQAADLLPRPSADRASVKQAEPSSETPAKNALRMSSPAAAASPASPSTTDEHSHLGGASAGISSSEEYMWYVRPPSGGQYGPATRAEIDRWDEEGRIPAESLVWREGWDDWRSAADSLRAEDSSDGPSRGNPLDLQAGPRGVVTGSDDRWAYQSVKKKRKATTVVLLSVACLILMVVFLLVVRPGSG